MPDPHASPSAQAPVPSALADAAPSPDVLAARKEWRETRQFWIDTGVKVFQAFVVVATGVWAVLQYVDQQNKELVAREEQQNKELSARNEQQKKEIGLRERELAQAKAKQDEDVAARQRAGYAKFYEEQRPQYVDLCKAAAQIAAAKKLADVPDAIATFRLFHSGHIRLVADQRVITALEYYSEELDRLLDPKQPAEQPSRDLQNRSHFLAMACRDSLDLKKVFDVDLQLNQVLVLEKSPYPF